MTTKDIDLYRFSDEIVDVVDRKDGSRAALAVDGSLVPAPCLTLLWEPPRHAEVEKYFSMPVGKMFAKVRDALASYSEQWTPDYYDLFATWIFLTYVHRWFPYSPQITLSSEQERGKSRAGHPMIHASFRGFVTTTANEAYLFRLGETGFSLCMDVVDIMERVRRQGSMDMMSSRFQQGVKTPRVNRPEDGSLGGIDVFESYGPTIMLTNKPVEGRWESRGFLITPPLSDRLFDDPPKEEEMLPIREMLTAWRWRMLRERPTLPAIQGLESGRFRDITKPLRQVAAMISPEPGHVDKALQHIYTARQASRATSDEANVLAAIEASRHEGGYIFTGDIRAQYFALTDWQPSPKWIGQKVASFGFELELKGPSRLRAIRHNPLLLSSLLRKYGREEERGK